ncbi:MAG TPA: ROK family transcriptional regulator [Steroidobacteraceae bacterium]|nr:ROK family transcriptional regulator [Steroidobacteraceae bacterium]
MTERGGTRRTEAAKAGALSSARDSVRRQGPQLSGTNLERAGDHNQRVTLQAIRVNGPITRNDLAEITGLTPPAIANITKRLMNDNLIMAAGRRRGGRGQPATRLVINPDGRFSIGINIDRDHISLVVLGFDGQVRAQCSRETAFPLPAAVERLVRRSVGPLLQMGKVRADRLLGIGVAFPDDIQRADLPEQPAEYAAWGSVSVHELLADILPVPVFIENDAAAAAMGEMHFGLGQRYQSFFYVLITAALGGGLVVDGQYFRGANGRSGELGWLPGRDESGSTRQLQKIVSLSALYSRLAARGCRVSSPRELTRLDAQASAIVDAWIEISAETLLDTLIAVNCLINPEAVLIGGRLPGPLVDRLAELLNRRLQAHAQCFPAIAPVARAATSEDAPAVGAAILPFSHRLLPTRFALMKTAGAA